MKIPKKIFDKYEIDLSWFKHAPSLLHGFLHEYRVLVHSYLIGIAEKADVDSLCYASIFHDVRREDDDLDLEHANRSVDWVEKNFNFSNLKEIIYLIKWHTPLDHKAPEMTLNLKCFKDADTLDRWRLREDLDTSYLRTKTSHKLTDFAKKLFELTDSQKEEIKDPKENILKALEKLGVLGM